MATEDTQLGAVYVSWTTFNNALNTLADAMPNRIDKTVFPTLAGGVQAQLLTALKFLGLVTKDGKPTEALRALAVKDENERKKQIAKILKASYPNLFALDLAKTTPGELREEMGKSYGVTGATTDRAIRFFVAAAEYANIPLSSLLSKGKAAAAGNSAGTGRRRRSPKARGERSPAPLSGETTGASKSVKLASGGTLTVSASLDLFSLSQKDRSFVFELIDKLDSYEKESEQMSEQEEKP